MSARITDMNSIDDGCAKGGVSCSQGQVRTIFSNTKRDEILWLFLAMAAWLTTEAVIE